MSAKISPAAGEKKYKVSGTVFNFNAEAIPGQAILAVDIDLRGAAIYRSVSTIKELQANRGIEFLGTAMTNADGYYEITFTADSYRRNEVSLADVIVFAVDGIGIGSKSGRKISANFKLSASDGKIVGRSRLATQKDYSGNEIRKLDIQLPNASKRGVSEYTRLMQVIEPFAKENGLQLSALSKSEDQVDFLASETNQDQVHTSLAVQASQLQSDYPKYKFSSEMFYGIGRQNIVLEWVALVQKTESDLTGAIQASVDQNIIPPQDAKVVERFVAKVLEVSLQHAVTAPETAAFFKTIGFAIGDPALRQTFSQTYLRFKEGRPEEFWQSLSQKPGFKPKVIRSLQLSNQLSILTGQNTALIEELQVKRAVKDPSELLDLSAEDWNKVVSTTGLPASTPGKTPQEQTANYITGMRNLLNGCYPTQKISLMVQNKQLSIADANLREGVLGFLTAAQPKGFDISTSRITDFEAVLKQVAGDLHDDVLKHLQLLQRLYQVSPTPEAMGTLMQKGYTSAYHIASVPRPAFIDSESEDLGGADVALSVHNRACHQVMRAHHTLLKIRDTLDPATPAKIISSAQQMAISDYLKSLNT